MIPSKVRFTCSECGKRLVAAPQLVGRRTLCRACGRMIRVRDDPCRASVSTALSTTTLVALPYSAPKVASVSSSVEPGLLPSFLRRPRGPTLWACLSIVAIGLPFIAYLGWALESERREEIVLEANESLAGEVLEARTLVSHGNFNKAIAMLEGTLATTRASEMDEARALLHKARQKQAQAIMAAVQAALQKHDPARARTLLRDFLGHPEAEEKGKARRLAAEIDLAVSDVKALELLKRLPPDALTAFVRSGTFADIRSIQSVPLREIYTATLKRNRARAQAIREEKRLAREKRARAEYDRRVARARSAPAFREVLELAARIRKKDQEKRKTLESFDRKLFEAAGALLTANDQNRTALRQEAAKVKHEREAASGGVERWKEQVDEQISRTRANVKERVRSYKEFKEDDRRLFEKLADAELDAVLKDVGKTDEDQGGL